MIDKSKCMSQTSETAANSPPTEVENHLNEVKCEKLPEERCLGNNNTDTVIENEEKMDTESIPERRFSQNSETNNDGQENTATQTDNDEV